MLAEVLQGFRNFAKVRDVRDVRDALMRFRIVQMVTLKLAVQSTQNFRLLRSKGVTVRKTIDRHLVHRERCPATPSRQRL